MIQVTDRTGWVMSLLELYMYNSYELQFCFKTVIVSINWNNENFCSNTNWLVEDN